MTAILELAGIRKAFGGIVALDDVALAIARPGIYGLIGPNGAGKTTLFDVVCGQQVPDNGTVRFEGQRIEALRVHQRARLGFSRTFQECRVLSEETCLDNVLFAAQDKRLGAELAQSMTRATRARGAMVAEAWRLLALVNLDGYADAPAAALSYGQRRLLEIVSALIARPRMLLLDEPASGVNPTLLDTLRDFLRQLYQERPIVFLIVEHNMEFIMSLASLDRGDAPGPDPGAGHAQRGAVRPARDRGLSRMSEALFNVRGLKAGYGDGRLIVDGVDLDVSAGEIVTMIGQNGAGKSTVLKGIYHMTRERHGSVSLGGQSLFDLPPHELLRRGLAYIPQQHTVFPKLTIAENLTMGGYLIARPWFDRRARRGRRGHVSGAGRAAARNTPLACRAASSACSRSLARW